jgi:membrane associated rhomboid family serine protease
MTQRFFVYPILLIAVMQLLPLLRRDQRWFAAQIAQLVVIVLACVGGLYFSHEFIWVIVAWALFVLFVVAPALLTAVAAAREQRGHWQGAAMFRRLASYVAWGQMGRLYRRYASVLRRMARGHTEEALTALDDLATVRMPLTMRGMVLTWKLSLLVTLRQWERAVAFHENVFDWGTLGQATQARMFAARALAETGQFERALRNLQFAMLSPRTLGARQTQLWATRVCIAALAGDTESVEELLRQRDHASRSSAFGRFAAYWRGRCALVRGQLGDAVRQLTRAYGLTHPRNQLWRDAITQQLHRAEEEKLPASWPAQDPMYVHGQELLRRAEQDTAPWRALMHMGRPEVVTLALLLALAVMYLVSNVILRGDLQDKLLLWGGNSADTVKYGEWWRLVTALFLHANPLHLFMNGAGLWIFGSAVEKTVGRWRFLVVFLLAGALGNLASASVAHYDVAIGASGGIFGVIGAFAVAVWRLRSPMYFALRRRLLVVLALMVATDFTIGGLEPHVDNLAHVGGFVAGIVIAAALWPRTENRFNIGRPTSNAEH